MYVLFYRWCGRRQLRLVVATPTVVAHITMSVIMDQRELDYLICAAE